MEMEGRDEWIKLDDVSEQIREENWSLYWAETKTESDRFELLVRDPLRILVEELDEVEEDWHVISQFINHHFPHKQNWICRVVIVMPEIKTALLTYYKHPEGG
ncbi:MAG TPA: hypothetical protein VFU16_04735 [Solirubrobacterales bacterium]|nr:hypothetical protein [Solirubrobacterales bacterium]